MGNSTPSAYCVDFCPEQCERQNITDIPAFLNHHRPDWSKVRWINLAAGDNPEIVEMLAGKYQLHPLAIEDVVQGTQRPKVEDYPGSPDSPGRLFIVARIVQKQGEHLHNEQVSIFLGRTTLLTFHAGHGALFNSIHHRLNSNASRLRTNDASFLCYSLLDTIVDDYFPLLETYSERLEAAEEELMNHPVHNTLKELHTLKRELSQIRRTIWPMREIVAQLQRDKHECLSETTLTYFRDLYDHCVQIIDLTETYHEIATAAIETYMSVMSNRMNEIMKVLTIISTIFIPLTFLAGVYGMNMPIPENHWPFTYPLFWLVCLIIAGSMLIWFHSRRWM